MVINVDYPVKDYWLKKLKFLLHEDMITDFIVKKDKIIVDTKCNENTHIYPNCTEVKNYFIGQQNKDYNAHKSGELSEIFKDLTKIGVTPKFIAVIGMKVYAIVDEVIKEVEYATLITAAQYAGLKKRWVKETLGIYDKDCEYKPAREAVDKTAD